MGDAVVSRREFLGSSSIAATAAGAKAAPRSRGKPAVLGGAPLDEEPFLANTLESRAFQKVYGKHALAEFRDRTHCPANEKLCEEGVWLTQTMLLGSRTDMDQIAEAIRKIQASYASELAQKDASGLNSARAGG
jgi:hypothetical protein